MIRSNILSRHARFRGENVAAIDAAEETFNYDALGQSYTRDAFKNQAKCCRIIRD